MPVRRQRGRKLADVSRLTGSNVCGVVESASRMPTISVFYGILIRMFFADHPPLHFHARDGDFEAIDIGTLAVIEGQLPRRTLNGPGMGDDA